MVLERRLSFSTQPSVPFRVGYDLDDCIIAHMPELLAYMKDVHNIEVPMSQLTHSSWGRAIGLSPDEENAFMWGFWPTKYYREANPIHGAIEGLRKIGVFSEGAAITARLRHQESITRRWVKRFCPQAFPLGIHYAENPYHGVAGETKAQIGERLRIDVAIEDSFYNAVDFSRAGINSILITRPWNLDFEDEGVKRVDTWSQIVREVTKLWNIKQAKFVNSRKRSR